MSLIPFVAQGSYAALRFLPLVLVLSVGSAQVPPEWTQRSPSVHPAARSQHGLAYDSVRGHVVLYGGYALLNGLNVKLADTWVWDGITWNQRFPAQSPGARDTHGLAYDSARGRTVLFGGADGQGNLLGDTWEWDGVTWTQQNPAINPPPRAWARLAYDSVRRRTVLFGGDGASAALSDTWEWDGQNWVQRPANPSPPARGWHQLAFDSVRATTVLFAGWDRWLGRGFGDTWEWDGMSWRNRLPPTSPAARVSPALCFDSDRGRTVLHAGSIGGQGFSDTWEWDGITWTQARVQSPFHRSHHSMAYDSSRHRAIFFGGSVFGGARLDETWEYGVLPSYTYFGSGCAGTRGLPSLTVNQLPRVGQPFSLLFTNLPLNQPGLVFLGLSNTTWNGIPLPLDLTGFGMPGCQLLASGEIIDVIPTTTNFGTVVWGFPHNGGILPNDPALIGSEFFNQGFFRDPGANPANLIVTNGGHGIIGT